MASQVSRILVNFGGSEVIATEREHKITGKDSIGHLNILVPLDAIPIILLQDQLGKRGSYEGLSSPAIRSFSHHTPAAHDRWIEDSKRRLRTLSEIDLRAHANAIATRASSGLSQVGRRLNEITGYDAIEELKDSVIRREQAISALKLEAREAKRAYETAVAERSACQREVNDLLQRKSSWSEADVGRFTALVRQDHINEQEEARAKERADATELLVESEFSELMRSILHRYHEEQVWSDKIRSASTYGSLAALGLNLIVFILAIVVVEPWKRKRLGETFEKRIVLMERRIRSLSGKA
ncbi:hypothetical protein BS47DRAFT_1434735 [Hydnum rufescens UP504]|uniref:Sensitive to high expression protein 9, mitochondrial n=1 Tax=Hydnum rufescens UP504 TaxID=1448309 RepID=A0A9P6DXA2_9AGAM|nr:hypothetical protein BS47DRAFT_1434735 [Hydnum rufescens UP504]